MLTMTNKEKANVRLGRLMAAEVDYLSDAGWNPVIVNGSTEVLFRKDFGVPLALSLAVSRQREADEDV